MNLKTPHYFLIAAALLLFTHFGFYPKWQQTNTEATISWDVSGYYLYLPAFFIYQDVEDLAFMEDILETYRPTSDFQQAFVHEPSGNRIMKYSAGQSVVFTPAFLLAHLWATVSDKYPADGFSFPYQFMISMGSLIIALLGIWVLLMVLRTWFTHRVAGLTVLTIVVGTNYLNYAAIDGAMTHNSLFTIYAILLWVTHRFYKRPTVTRAIPIGLLVGLAALIRPTEILAAIIPLLWQLDRISWPSIRQRLRFYVEHAPALIVAVILCGLVGFVQLAYWKYAAGEWIVYSYQDQGFSWLHPHLLDGFLSYKSGWLTYSPIMVFALIGFGPLYRQEKGMFWPAIVFSALFIYVTFAWDIWWYGGSLGQRAMVQAYPVLSLPLAAFLTWLFQQKKWITIPVLLVFLLFAAANLWFTRHAHRNGLLKVGQMTKAYYWKSLGRSSLDTEYLKLLDTDEYFSGDLRDVQTIFPTEPDSVWSARLSGENQFSEPVELQVPSSIEWVRASAQFDIDQKEWNYWQMTQWQIRYLNGESIVKERMIRVHRLLRSNQQDQELFFDSKAPNAPFNRISVLFWNAESTVPITISDLRVETFRSN